MVWVKGFSQTHKFSGETSWTYQFLRKYNRNWTVWHCSTLSLAHFHLSKCDFIYNFLVLDPLWFPYNSCQSWPYNLHEVIILWNLPTQAVLSALNWKFAAHLQSAVPSVVASVAVQAHSPVPSLVAPVGQAERFGKKKSFSF